MDRGASSVHNVTDPNLKLIARMPTLHSQLGSSVPSLSQDIFDLIFAALCPPAPSQWIHGVGKDGLSAPAQPPDLTLSEQRIVSFPINTLLVSRDREGRNRPGVQNNHYVEYKTCMQTLANVARTCSWARRLVERYLYRYVVLVSGGQLARFAAAVEGRWKIAGEDESLKRDEDGAVELSRLGRYVWGCYCFVNMEREADLGEWYQFEMDLKEWKMKKLLETGLAEGLDKAEREEEKKRKKKKNKKKKPKQKATTNGKEKLEILHDPENKGKSSVGCDEAVCRDRDRNRGNSTAGASTTSAKSSSASARRSRRKKTESTKQFLQPLDAMGEFFRVHSAMLDTNLNHDYMYDRKTSLAPRNMYNLFLRLLLQPRYLPNLHDLLCPWYCIQRVVGLVKEPHYLPVWIPGRTKLDVNPSVLHKIKTFTIRPPVLNLDDDSDRYYPCDSVACDLGVVIDAFPNLETLDTCYLGNGGRYGSWLPRPLLTETEHEKQRRIFGHVIGTSPVKHVRVYLTCESPAIIAAFCKALRPGALETLLVRFHMLRPFPDLGHFPGCVLLGHEGLIDSGSDSLRYLELLSTPATHYLTRTEEMENNPRLIRLTCLPFLHKLEELVVDFQGLFGAITHLEEQDTDLLHRGGCLPPNLVMLKVVCVWSCTHSDYDTMSAPEGEYVVSDNDVAIFIIAFRAAHQAGTMTLSSSLRKLTLVVPDQLSRVCAASVEGGRIVAAEKKRKALIEAKEYFNGTEVEFAVETGLNVLKTAAGT